MLKPIIIIVERTKDMLVNKENKQEMKIDPK